MRDVNIPSEVVGTLLGAGGNAVKLYILRLAEPELSPEREREKCGLTDYHYRYASDSLIKLGLAPGAGAKYGVVSESAHAPGQRRQSPVAAPPEYTNAELSEAASGDPEFKSVLDAVCSSIGRTLNATEAKYILLIYREYGLPADVMILMTTILKTRAERETGLKTSVTNLAAIKRLARDFCANGVDSLDKAEQYSLESEQLSDYALEYKNALNLKFIPDDARALLNKWRGWGFPVGAAIKAGERTFMAIGQHNFKYADAIMSDWHEKGYKTVADIERADKSRKYSARPRTAVKKDAAPAPDSPEMRALERPREDF